MQFAVSRQREYLADASGVQLTRYPPGLISALEKLKDDHTVPHMASKATAHLWIEQPLDKETNKGHTRLNHLFDTHPPLDDRIRRPPSRCEESDVKNLWRTRRVPILDRRGGPRRRHRRGAIAIASSGSSQTPAAKKKQRPCTRRRSRPRRPASRRPLTGLPDRSGKSFERPAVTVKINNTSAAQPQYGVDQADVVYEEVVEGGITRLAAIFNSHAPDRVGPVRSVRKTDPSIVWPIRGIFAYSGGAQYAIDSIDTAPVEAARRDARRIDDDPRTGHGVHRRPERPDRVQRAPLNLFAHVDQMFNAGGEPIPPPPLFTYRKAGAHVAGTPVTSLDVGFVGGYAVTWTWDAKSGTWFRSKLRRPRRRCRRRAARAEERHRDGRAVLSGGAGVEGAEATLTGTGQAMVFTGGKEIKGTWTRPDHDTPAKFADRGRHADQRSPPARPGSSCPDTALPVTLVPDTRRSDAPLIGLRRPDGRR